MSIYSAHDLTVNNTLVYNANCTERDINTSYFSIRDELEYNVYVTGVKYILDTNTNATLIILPI